MDDEQLAGLPEWKKRAFWAAATFTPLRFMPVRQAAFRAAAARARRRRRRREARGDASLSTPSLFGMDRRLADMLGRDGYFVEAGAHDGYTQSNTYYLEHFMGWKGLLVEPMPQLAAEARRNRPASRVVEAALTDPQGAGEPVHMKFAGLLSIVEGAKGSPEADRAWVAGAFARGEADVRDVVVTGRTLSELLDEAGAPEVDLLSLDLEGHEPAALRGLDLERHGPRYLLVEAHEPEWRARIEAVLGDRYVHVERFSEFDDLYRRADVPAA